MTVRQTPHLPPLGLYLHIPFCERKCPYCDFNTYAGLHALHQDTVDALCREMEQRAADAAGRTVVSIFIGGGTPTLLTPAQLEQLLKAIQMNFEVASTAEISCEANPGAVDRERFMALRMLGVNRLSMGVQSFQPEELKFLGRIHDVADVYVAFDAARAVGFDNINLDFIFGLPRQPLVAWSSTPDSALALAPEHLSLYSLIVEPDTPLEHWVHTGQVEVPDEDNAADHYELAMERLAAGGYWQYEVSTGRSAPPANSRRCNPCMLVGTICSIGAMKTIWGLALARTAISARSPQMAAFQNSAGPIGSQLPVM
ncbi:MAG: radical SAM family heme chaperone HemW [Anaerolineales bacterium]|nr:radical SAM family heme chaperone HemW [Anaerolineales bacterium]